MRQSHLLSELEGVLLKFEISIRLYDLEENQDKYG